MTDDLRAETIEVFRKALMVEHSDDWTMETVAEAAHICARALHRAERADDNSILAAGAIWAALAMLAETKETALTRVDIAEPSEASVHVWFAFLESRYRITVRIDPEPEVDGG